MGGFCALLSVSGRFRALGAGRSSALLRRFGALGAGRSWAASARFWVLLGVSVRLGSCAPDRFLLLLGVSGPLSACLPEAALSYLGLGSAETTHTKNKVPAQNVFHMIRIVYKFIHLLLYRQIDLLRKCKNRSALGRWGLGALGRLLRASERFWVCLLYTSPTPRDRGCSRMASSA